MSPNQRSVGDMLNTLANTDTGTSGDLNTVLNAIDNLSNTSQVASALDQIAPRGDMAAANITINGSRIQSYNIAARLQNIRSGIQGVSLRGLNLMIDQDEDMNRYGKPFLLAFNGDGLPTDFKVKMNESWGFFMTGDGTYGDMKSSVSQPGYTFRNVGLTLGGDYRFTKNFVAGLMGGYNRTRSDMDDFGSRAVINTFMLGSYGTYYGNGLYLDGLFNIGWNNVDKDRRIVYPGVDRTATSDQRGIVLALSGGTGYDFRVNKWILTPKLTLDFAHLSSNDYTESGASSLNLQVEGQTSKLMLGQLGGSLTYLWNTGKVLFMPRIWAMAGRELIRDDQIATTARLAMGSGSFTTFSVPPDKNFLTLGFGITLSLPQGTSLYINASCQGGQSNYYAYNLSGGLRMSF
jgi:outer membrane autotransporter protein